MQKRVRSDVDRARVDELVADIGRLIRESEAPLPSDISPEDRALADTARFELIRATNAVSAAALGSDLRSIDSARLAVEAATDAIRAARLALRRHEGVPRAITATLAE